MASERRDLLAARPRHGNDQDAGQFNLAAALTGISEIEERMTSLSTGLDNLEHLEWSKSARRLCDLTASLRRKIRYRMTEQQVVAAVSCVLQDYA